MAVVPLEPLISVPSGLSMTEATRHPLLVVGDDGCDRRVVQIIGNNVSMLSGGGEDLYDE